MEEALQTQLKRDNLHNELSRNLLLRFFNSANPPHQRKITPITRQTPRSCGTPNLEDQKEDSGRTTKLTSRNSNIRPALSMQPLLKTFKKKPSLQDTRPKCLSWKKARNMRATQRSYHKGNPQLKQTDPQKSEDGSTPPAAPRQSTGAVTAIETRDTKSIPTVTRESIEHPPPDTFSDTESILTDSLLLPVWSLSSSMSSLKWRQNSQSHAKTRRPIKPNSYRSLRARSKGKTAATKN